MMKIKINFLAVYYAAEYAALQEQNLTKPA